MENQQEQQEQQAPEFDAVQMEGLTTAERAALAEPEGAGSDAAPVDDAPQEDAAEPDAATAESEGGASAPAPEAAPEAAKLQEPQAPYTFTLPAEFAEKQKLVEEKQTALDEEFSAGEMQAHEYMRRMREVARMQAELDAMQFKAEFAAEMQQQAVQRARNAESEAWAQAMQQFAGQLGEGAPDYLQSQADGMALAQQARAILAARGVPDGAPVAGKLDILHQAHEVLQMVRGGGKAAAPQQAKQQAMAARRADLGAAPASLGTVPGADGGNADAFERLAQLDGAKLEEAMGRLARTDPAAYERWLAAE